MMGTAGLPAYAQDRPILTLAQAQHVALEHHPNLKIAEFDEAAAKDAIDIARAAYSPQAFGSAVQAFTRPGTRISAPGTIGDPTVLQRTGFGINISQYVTDFGRTADVVASLQLAHKAQVDNGEVTQQTMLLNVTQAYFEVLRARAMRSVAEQTVHDRETLLKQVTSLQKAGLRSTLDVSIAQRDKATAEQMLLDAQTQVRDAYAMLTQALGLEDEVNYRVVDAHDLPELPKSIGPLLDEMLHSNPALAAAQDNAAAAGKNADAVAKLNKPTVTAYGYIGATPIRAMNQAIASSYETAGITMNVPIVNGGALKAQAREAAAVAAAADEATEGERVQLIGRLRTAFDDVQSARGDIDATTQILKTATQAFEFTESRYRIGLNSIVDVSNAELSQTQAAIMHENAIYNYIEQGAALEFATGVLAPAT